MYVYILLNFSCYLIVVLINNFLYAVLLSQPPNMIVVKPNASCGVIIASCVRALCQQDANIELMHWHSKYDTLFQINAAM